MSGNMAHAQNSLDEVIRFMENNPNKVYDRNREKVNKQEEETAHVYYPA